MIVLLLVLRSLTLFFLTWALLCIWTNAFIASPTPADERNARIAAIAITFFSLLMGWLDCPTGWGPP